MQNESVTDPSPAEDIANRDTMGILLQNSGLLSVGELRCYHRFPLPQPGNFNRNS